MASAVEDCKLLPEFRCRYRCNLGYLEKSLSDVSQLDPIIIQIKPNLCQVVRLLIWAPNITFFNPMKFQKGQGAPSKARHVPAVRYGTLCAHALPENGQSRAPR